MGKKFSERIGVTQPKAIQMDSMDKDLKISIWNVIADFIYEKMGQPYWSKVAAYSARDFFKEPSEEFRLYGWEYGYKWLKRFFDELTWNKIYEYAEFLVCEVCQDASTNQSHLEKSFNTVFEREFSGYRFVSGKLVPITNKMEQSTIQTAIENSIHCGLPGASTHLETALRHLSKKPEPDYRNASKEAISAVETAVKKLSGVESSGLDPALKEICDRVKIHGALRAAFSNLYGYTSDEDGIRHAILEDGKVGLPEARFMVVACSCFVNYLVSKADEAGMFAKE